MLQEQPLQCSTKTPYVVKKAQIPSTDFVLRNRDRGRLGSAGITAQTREIFVKNSPGPPNSSSDNTKNRRDRLLPSETRLCPMPCHHPKIWRILLPLRL